MLNTIYQLKQPRQFDITFKSIDIDSNHIIVRPTHLSICHADQRYYQGLRPEKVLREKLPMALIHEGIGKVIYDPTDTFDVGSKVVMIPNTPMENSSHINENYLKSSKFRGSGFDGFLQEYVSLEPSRVVALPIDMNDYVGAFTEIVSVSYHAISRFEKFSHSVKDSIGVWGDGNLGYITSLLLKKMYPKSKVYVFGVNSLKLNDFTFTDDTFLVGNIPKDLSIDHAFECVGGGASTDAINQIIDCISPEGTISLMGVSENNIPINTRMVLEKGLKILGSSRSGRDDFIKLIELYQTCPDILLYLENIVGSVITVRNIKDIILAFETDIHSMIGKTIMVWNK